MKGYVDFKVVLDMFESRGWVLRGSCSNYRIFIHPTREIPPFGIPVQNKKVSVYYVKKIQDYFDDKEDRQ